MNIMSVFGLAKGYPIPVTIYKKRGNAWIRTNDKARLEKDTATGKPYLFFKKYKRANPQPPPRLQNLIINSKGKTIMEFAELQIGKLIPMPIKDNPIGRDIGTDVDVDFWKSIQDRKTVERYGKKESFWTKYASYILLAMTCGVFLFTVFFVVQQMAEIASAVGGVSGPLKAAVDRLAYSLEQAYNIPPPP